MTDLPAIQVESITTVRKDANHNAFTDLCVYSGRFYLTFRSSPDGHRVSSCARVVVLESDDALTWSEAFTFSVPGRDTRDPHFLVFRGSLFVYTGTWLLHGEGVPLNLNEHLGYAAWTDDGSGWNGPAQMEGTYGHYIWRAASHGDRAYLCGRRRRGYGSGIEDEQQPGSIESAMLTSADGLVWYFHSLFAGDYGDETAFLFEEDGSALALVRDGAGKRARICRSAPPWKAWTSACLERNVGGPLIVRWGGRYLVGGRKSMGDTAATSLWWLHGDALHEAVELPSGGDSSYPGFVALSEERGLLSYYSSHEGGTAVYLAELALGQGRGAQASGGIRP
ncbi:MAG: hypothetical protein OXH50_13110 [Gemmatimonadetes bacterium]|nr:hypothetical protein [Gemmatimonadota bacterium]